MENIIFTLTGKAGCGKDVIAKMIKDYLEELGKTSFSLAYADYLKCLATRNLGYDDSNKEATRHIVQEFGESVRGFDERFWVDTVWHTIDSFRDMYEVFIVTDARYENELRPYPYRIGYPIINIYIKRDNFESKLGEQELQHVSEAMATNPDLEKFNFIVDNSGTFEETYNAIKLMIDTIYEAKELAQKSYEGVEIDELLQSDIN